MSSNESFKDNSRDRQPDYCVENTFALEKYYELMGDAK
jgi:hypothetical protein